MFKTKKGILIMVLAVCIVLAGSIVGAVTFAQSGSNSQTQTISQQDQQDALLAKVAQIYQTNTGVALDTQQLKAAFTQAQQDLRDEALQNRLNKLVEDGKLNQSEADAFLNWWKARPDTNLTRNFGLGFEGRMQIGGKHGLIGGFGCQPPDTASTPDVSGSGT